jgi:hypothetical protein
LRDASDASPLRLHFDVQVGLNRADLYQHRLARVLLRHRALRLDREAGIAKLATWSAARSLRHGRGEIEQTTADP